MPRFSALLGSAATMLVATLVSASAQQVPMPHMAGMARVGVLECTGGPSTGWIVGSVTNLNCALNRGGRRGEPYVAQIRRFGFDVGYTDRWVMAWEVWSPARVPPGGISGSYAGAGASASVGPGAASNQMIGGPGGSLTLVPLEVNGQQGVNLAFGFEGMDIRPAGY